MPQGNRCPILYKSAERCNSSDKLVLTLPPDREICGEPKRGPCVGYADIDRPAILALNGSEGDLCAFKLGYVYAKLIPGARPVVERLHTPNIVGTRRTPKNAHRQAWPYELEGAVDR